MADNLKYTAETNSIMQDGSLKTGQEALLNGRGFGNTDYNFGRYYSNDTSRVGSLRSSSFNQNGMSYLEIASQNLSESKSAIYARRQQNPIEQISQEYNPAEKKVQEENQADKPLAYNALELIAHQILVNQHAYQGLNEQNNSASYFAANGNYSISASEGYIGNGIGYLTLAIARQNEELQRYTLMLKYHDEKNRRTVEDESLAEDIDELLAKIRGKEEVNSDDVLEFMKNVLQNRKETDENLAVTELHFRQIEHSIKKQLKAVSHDKLSSMILMLEIEKNVKFRQLIIKKEPKEEEVIDAPKKEITYNYVPSYLEKISD